MCDKNNAEEIVSEMLTYLETADYSIKEEMVTELVYINIAILMTKYILNWFLKLKFFVLMSIITSGVKGGNPCWEVCNRLFLVHGYHPYPDQNCWRLRQWGGMYSHLYSLQYFSLWSQVLIIRWITVNSLITTSYKWPLCK